MLENKHLLIVGGTKRNVGKTTFIERVLQRYSDEYDIVAFKIKTIYPNDSFFHGKDRNPLSESENYRITEEKLTNWNEGSNRMLIAGAKKVFKIKCKAQFLYDAFVDFQNRVGSNTLLICESNSLRKYVIPALYLFIKEQNSKEMKPSASEMIKYADKIIITDGKNHDFNISSLEIKNTCWNFKL